MLSQTEKDMVLKAFRSGEYAQARGEYYGQDGRGGWSMCALGLMAWVLDGGTREKLSRIQKGDRFPRAKDILTHKLRHQSVVLEQIISMNDKDGKSFLEIADWIEAYLPAAMEPVQREDSYERFRRGLDLDKVVIFDEEMHFHSYETMKVSPKFMGFDLAIAN